MSKVKFVWNNDGFKEILQSKQLEKVCLDAATAIAKNANAIAEGYGDKNKKDSEPAEFVSLEWSSNMKGGRVAAVAATHNRRSKEVQAESHVLEKAALMTRS